MAPTSLWIVTQIRAHVTPATMPLTKWVKNVSVSFGLNSELGSGSGSESGLELVSYGLNSELEFVSVVSVNCHVNSTNLSLTQGITLTFLQ